MQPIVLLGVAVAAVALVGTGFLQGEGTMWNEFELWVQQLGWGEAALTSPISHAFVDLEIKKIVNDNGTPESDCPDDENREACEADKRRDDFFDNVISDCSFHADKNIPAPPTPITNELDVLVLHEGIIICKMLNEDGNAIAEGQVSIVDIGGYVSSEKILIPINQCILASGHVSTAPGIRANCLDVQTPIHFVKLVVEDALWDETDLEE